MAVLNQCDIASALNWNRVGVTFGGLSGMLLSATSSHSNA